MVNKVFNKTWAEDSTNKDVFNEEQISNGIAYQGAVVSPQLNGLGAVLSQAIAYQQKAGGYYANDKIYKKNDIISIAHIGTTHPLMLEFYVCLSETPISGKCPILNAAVDSSQDVAIYSGGDIDVVNWKRIDNYGAGSSTIKLTQCGGKIYKLITTNNITSLEGISQDIGGEVSVIVESNSGGVASFDMKLTSKIIKKNDNSLVNLGNGYGDPVPSVQITNLFEKGIIRNEIDSFSDEILYLSDINNLILYGIKFEVRYENKNKNNYAIYLVCREDIVSVSFNLTNISGITIQPVEVLDANHTSVMWLPVINNLGTESSQIGLGKLFEVDYIPSEIDIYNWGAVDVSQPIDLSSSKYGMFGRKFNRRTDISHEACHTRVYSPSIKNVRVENNPIYEVGSQIIPALPNVIFGDVCFHNIGDGGNQGNELDTFGWYWTSLSQYNSTYVDNLGQQVHVQAIVVNRYLKVF